MEHWCSAPCLRITPKAQELLDALWGLKEAFLVGFFLLIGMSGLPGREAIVLALVALALLPLKGVLFYGLLVGFKLRARSGVLAGLALANYSEFGLIVMQAGAARGLVPESWVVALAITVAMSFAVSAPLIVPRTRSTRDSRRSSRASNAGSGIRTTSRFRSARRTS